MEEAAKDLAHRLGIRVLAKGGHLPDGSICDILATPLRGGAVTLQEWRDARIETRHSHGTGCTLSSAIATLLAKGLAPSKAINDARHFVREAMLAAPGFGAGHGPMGHALGVVPFDLILRKAK
jgi:hydroxymethylpyrimidine/phosphomethylpyrimidine kinase